MASSTQAIQRSRRLSPAIRKKLPAKEYDALNVFGLSCIRKRMEGSMRVKATKNNDSHGNSHGRRKWSAAVATDSTHPHAGLFNKDAKTIARELASKKVSPKGPSSGMRMLTFYINRAGKNLPANRVKVLENAKQLLHERILAAKDQEKKASRKKTAQHGKKAA
jgi:hypothetical protein